MATTNKFIDLGDISFMSAEYLHNTGGVLKRVNKDYDNRFAQTGAKIGAVTQARLPTASRFNTDTSSTNIELQSLNDKGMPVVLNKNYQRSFAVDAVDLTLSTDDFAMRYMNPHMRSMAAQIENDIMLALLANTPNAVGTPGTAVSSTTGFQALVGQARQKLVDNLANPTDTFYMATPQSLSTVGYTYATQLFNPQPVISDIANSGVISKLGGFDWFETTLASPLAAPTYGGSPVVNGASQSGSSLITNGWTATSTTLPAGTTFTVAGVYAINPETKVSLGYLKQFSVTATSSTDGSGNSTLAISPEIIGPGDPRQNVSRLPTTSDIITVLAASGQGGSAGIAFHRDAIIFATADIGPAGATQMGAGARNGGADMFTASLPDLGMSASVALQFDIRSRQWIMRIDVLAGIAPLYPQLASKLIYA